MLDTYVQDKAGETHIFINFVQPHEKTETSNELLPQHVLCVKPKPALVNSSFQQVE